MAFLEVQNLSVYYGGVAAVRNVTLFVGENEVVVLMGINGAGKSSLLKALFGLIPPFTFPKANVSYRGVLGISQKGALKRPNFPIS